MDRTTRRELLEQLAASVVAELELSAARSAVGTSLTRLDVALEASSIGIWERDLRTGVIDWDERCAAIFGLEGAAPVPRTELLDGARFVTPTTTPPLQEAMAGARCEQPGQFTVEFRALHAPTARCAGWSPAAGWSPIRRGEPVRLLGTILDVTDARRQAAAAAVGHAAGDGDRRGGRRARQRGAHRASCPRSCCAARRCSARSPARWPSSSPTGGRCGCT